MSEQEQVVEQQEETQVDELAVLRAQLEEATKLLAEKDKSIEAINSKKNELLNETKAAKQEREKQKAEALKIAAENGEFEKLWKQAEEEKNSLLTQLQQDRKDRRNEKIEIKASEIAADLAGNARDAVLLKKLVAESLGNIADEYGQVESEVIQGVKKQFETDELYSSLRKGNQSQGGSAPGNSRGAGNVVNEITMEQFNKLNPMQKLEFSRLVTDGKAKLSK